MEKMLTGIRNISDIVGGKRNKTGFYDALCQALADGIGGSVLFYSLKGKELGRSRTTRTEIEEAFSGEADEERKNLPSSVYRRFEEIEETEANVQRKEKRLLIESCFPEGTSGQHFMLIPVSVWGKALGTLLLARSETEFSSEDILMGEYAAMIAGMELDRRSRWAGAEKKRSEDSVDFALKALSGSEKAALQYIFHQILDSGNERVVLRNVARELGIAKATVGNALRKGEMAGVVKIQSYGTKGTGIRVVNCDFVRKLLKEQW